MKKKIALTAIITSAIIISIVAGGQVVEVAEGNMYPYNFEVTIQSSSNTTYAKSNIPLAFTSSIGTDFESPQRWSGYSIDEGQITTLAYRQQISFGVFTGNTSLIDLSEGSHKLVIYAENRYNSTKMPNITLSAQATVYFTIDTTRKITSSPSITPSPNPSDSSASASSPTPSTAIPYAPLPTPRINPIPSPSPSSNLTLTSPTQQPTLEHSPDLGDVQGVDFTPTLMLFGMLALTLSFGVSAYFYFKRKETK